ncbi:MAG: TIGR02588 family protein [Leptolyngbya sp. SIO4C1]|nr:TIGR02588 family protein [Leptolyngbya sp. SIO4C1]
MKPGLKSLKQAVPALARSHRSLAEWLTLAVSACLLIGLVGLVIYDWQVNQNRPPRFDIELVETAQVGSQYYVPFIITNTGGQVARTVQVSAELQLTNADTETGDQSIDFLSAQEQKRGSFVFDHDPQQGTLTVRVASFRQP